MRHNPSFRDQRCVSNKASLVTSYGMFVGACFLPCVDIPPNSPASLQSDPCHCVCFVDARSNREYSEAQQTQVSVLLWLRRPIFFQDFAFHSPPVCRSNTLGRHLILEFGETVRLKPFQQSETVCGTENIGY